MFFSTDVATKMRGKAGSRGFCWGGNALYLRTRYCTPEKAGITDCSDLIPLRDYCLQKGITRHKADGLLKRHYLLCTSFHGVYYVMENPNQLPTEREFTRRLPKRKRGKGRGVYESEKNWLNKQHQKRSASP